MDTSNRPCLFGFRRIEKKYFLIGEMGLRNLPDQSKTVYDFCLIFGVVNRGHVGKTSYGSQRDMVEIRLPRLVRMTPSSLLSTQTRRPCPHSVA